MDFVNPILKKFCKTPIEDLLKTFTVFSAQTISDACKKYLSSQKSTVLISGGGAKNPVLTQHLRENFSPYKVKNFEDFFSFSGDAKESIAFAYFAYEKFNLSSSWSPLPKKSLGKLAFPF